MTDDRDQQKRLIQALNRADVYPHAVDGVQTLETHISVIVLAGDYAYKIKKAVDLGFADFSTLSRRHYFCHEELRLNRRLAPQIYLAVVGLTGSPEDPAIDGDGAPFEYAVQMRRFDQTMLLNRVLERGEVTRAMIDQIAVRIASFHEQLPVVGADLPYGTSDAVLQPMRENFEALGPLLEDPFRRQQIEQIRHWTLARHRALTDELDARRARGFVRECHGDMHLANMVALGSEVVIFDCIEFNPALRWIDVMSELAFLAMDLDDRGAPGFSYRAVNRYLEETGDYAGLSVFGLYRVYRAMVRAKVAGIRLGQGTLDDRERRDLEAECGGYLDLAERYTRGETPGLIITHGLSGSGKTTLSQDALEHLGAIRVRSDAERKRLAGMAPAQRSDAGLSEGLYSADATRATYDRLAELANLITGAGFTAIVDAAFLQAWQRRLMAELAERQGLPLLVLDVEASEAELRRRVRERAAANTDASDAGIQVLEHQLGHRDPLGADLPRVRVRSGEPLPIAEIRQHLER